MTTIHEQAREVERLCAQGLSRTEAWARVDQSASRVVVSREPSSPPPTLALSTMSDAAPAAPPEAAHDWHAAGDQLWSRAQELAGPNASPGDLRAAFAQAQREHPDLADSYDRKAGAGAPPRAVAEPTSRRNAVGGETKTETMPPMFGRTLDGRPVVLTGDGVLLERQETPREANEIVHRRALKRCAGHLEDYKTAWDFELNLDPVLKKRIAEG